MKKIWFATSIAILCICLFTIIGCTDTSMTTPTECPTVEPTATVYESEPTATAYVYGKYTAAPTDVPTPTPTLTPTPTATLTPTPEPTHAPYPSINDEATYKSQDWGHVVVDGDIFQINNTFLFGGNIAYYSEYVKITTADGSTNTYLSFDDVDKAGVSFTYGVDTPISIELSGWIVHNNDTTIDRVGIMFNHFTNTVEWSTDIGETHAYSDDLIVTKICAKTTFANITEQVINWNSSVNRYWTTWLVCTESKQDYSNIFFYVYGDFTLVKTET